jgi:hypothetical protein
VIILGGSNYALPPTWLNIPGHRSCLGTVENIVNGHTGKSLSEPLIFASTNPKYDDRLFIELQVQYMKISSSNLGRTCCVQKLFPTFRTIFLHNMFSPCSAKRRASDKDLPVQSGVYQLENHLGVLKTLGIKFQMPFKALLMLDIQNMKVSKAIYIFFGAGISLFF